MRKNIHALGMALSDTFATLSCGEQNDISECLIFGKYV